MFCLNCNPIIIIISKLIKIMEKYTGAKTIGDGTYGSVLKAINKQNGKYLKIRPKVNMS